MTINTKLNLSNSKFEQTSGETLTLNGSTIIEGTLNFASGYTPTGDTSVPTKLYIDQNGVDSLTFQNGLTETNNVVELGGFLNKDIVMDTKGNTIDLSNNVNFIANGTKFKEQQLDFVTGAVLQATLAKDGNANPIKAFTHLGGVYVITGDTLTEAIEFTPSNTPSGFTGGLTGGSGNFFQGISSLDVLGNGDDSVIYVGRQDGSLYTIDFNNNSVNRPLSGSTVIDGAATPTFIRHIDVFFPDFAFTFNSYIVLANSNSEICVYNVDLTSSLGKYTTTTGTTGDLLPSSSISKLRIAIINTIGHVLAITDNRLFIVNIDTNEACFLDQNGLSNGLLFNDFIGEIIGNPENIERKDDGAFIGIEGFILTTDAGYVYDINYNSGNLVVGNSLYVGDGNTVDDLTRNNLGGVLSSEILVSNGDVYNYEYFDITKFTYISNLGEITNGSVLDSFLYYNQEYFVSITSSDLYRYEKEVPFKISLTTSGFTYPSTYISAPIDGLITRRILSGQTINDFTSYSANTENIAGADAFNDLRLTVTGLTAQTSADDITYQNGITRIGNNVRLGDLWSGGDVLQKTDSTISYEVNDYNLKYKSSDITNINITSGTTLETLNSLYDFELIYSHKIGKFSGETYTITSAFGNNSSDFIFYLTKTIDASGTTTGYLGTADTPIIGFSGATGFTSNEVPSYSHIVDGIGYVPFFNLSNGGVEDALIINLYENRIDRLTDILTGTTDLFISYQGNFDIIPFTSGNSYGYKLITVNNNSELLYYNSLSNTQTTIKPGDATNGDLSTMFTISALPAFEKNVEYNDFNGDNILLGNQGNTGLTNSYYSYNISTNTLNAIDLSGINFNDEYNIINLHSIDFLSFNETIPVPPPPTEVQVYGLIFVGVNGVYTVTVDENFVAINSDFKYFDEYVINLSNQYYEKPYFNYNLNRTRYHFVESSSPDNNLINTIEINYSTIFDRFNVIDENFILYGGGFDEFWQNGGFGLSSAFRRSGEISIGTLNNNTDIQIDLTSNGFQYPSGYTPTENTNLLTLGNRNATSNNVITSATTLTNDDHTVFVNSTGSSVTVTLVAAPKDGLVYTIKDVTGNATTNPITIDGNGKTIDGAVTITINIDYYGYQLTYSSVLDKWLITNTINY